MLNKGELMDCLTGSVERDEIFVQVGSVRYRLHDIDGQRGLGPTVLIADVDQQVPESEWPHWPPE
jgi:hypothetical protein